MINPYSSGTYTSTGKGDRGAEAEEAASTVALIMCYQELLDNLPEHLRKQTYLEIVPLHSVLAADSASPDQQVRQRLQSLEQFLHQSSVTMIMQARCNYLATPAVEIAFVDTFEGSN